MPEPIEGERQVAAAGAAVATVPIDLVVDTVAPGDGDADAPLARKGFGIGFWVSVGWLALLGAVMLLAPVLPLDDRNARDIANRFIGPSKAHWFGADDLGRDLLSRTIWGGRVSILIGATALVCGFLIGGFIGITAGFFRGRYERIAMGLMDVMLSFPSLILALALVAALSKPGTQEGSFNKVVVVLTVLAVPALARITRANTLVYSQREFVVAARAMGARPARVLVREILPNVLPAMLSFCFIALAILVVAEGALAFLGVSVEAPAVTWGKLIQGGKGDMDKAPWLSLIPCAFLFLTLLSLNFIGDKLQTRFSVREGQI